MTLVCIIQPEVFGKQTAGKDLDDTFYVIEMLDEYQEEIEDEHLDDDTLVDPREITLYE